MFNLINHRRRKKKAFSLVELVVVVLISAIFIGVIIKWLFAVSSVVGANIKAGVNTQVVVAVDKLEDDLRRSQNCLDRGNDSVLRSMNDDPYTLNFYTNPSNAIRPSIVSWRIYEGKLQRAIKTLDANCLASSSFVDGDYITMTNNVDTINSYIAPLNTSTGLPATTPELYPDACNYLSDTGCGVKYFTIHLVISTNTISYFDRTVGFNS